MGVNSEKGRLKILIDEKAPEENHCKPAADFLFRSAAKALGKHCLGVIMTGMGKDGCAGLMELKKSGIADRILPLEELAPALEKAARKK